MAVRIVLVEDKEEHARDLKQKAERLGYEVVASTDEGEEAGRLTAEHTPDLVLMNIGLRGRIDGLEATRQIQARHQIPVVVVSGRLDDERIREASEVGVSAVLHKPVDPESLRAAVGVAIHQARERQERDRHRDNLRAWSLAALEQDPATCDHNEIYAEILEHVTEGLHPSGATLYRVAEGDLVRVARLTRQGGETGVVRFWAEDGERAEDAGPIARRAAREGVPVSDEGAIAVPLMQGDRPIAVLYVEAESGQSRIEQWRQDVTRYAEVGGRRLCNHELDGDIAHHLEELRGLTDLDDSARSAGARKEARDDRHGQARAPEPPAS